MLMVNYNKMLLTKMELFAIIDTANRETAKSLTRGER